MARPTRESPSPSPLAPALLRYVRSRGGDSTLLACRFGWPTDAEEKDELAVTAIELNELLRATADTLRDPFVALRLPADLPLRRYGHAELAIRACTTVRDAFETFSRYASLVHPHLTCSLEEKNDEVEWIVATPAHPRGVGRHVHEFGLAYALEHCRSREKPIVVNRVYFAHARPPDLLPLIRFFQTENIDFGATNSGFSFNRHELQTPRASGDSRLLVTARDLADAAMRTLPTQSTIASRVETHIAKLLPNDATIDAVAVALHMSARTLQRRLDDESTGFSEVLDNVRRERAIVLLSDPSQSITEISYLLGFSDLATFSRAFKRWTGKPPGMWRRS